MVNLMGYSVLVDNKEQLKILQEIASEQGIEWKYDDEEIKNVDKKSFQFGYGGERIITYSSKRKHYQDKYITKKAHFNDLFNNLEQCNMKLTKENVYINLQGKTKEELTELYWLLKDSDEKMYRNELEDFLLYKDDKTYFLDFDYNDWGSADSDIYITKTEVTIEQLKEILQPMENKEEQLRKEAKKRGYTHDNFKCLKDLKHTSNPDLNKWYYEGCTDTLFSNSCGNGGKVVYKEGVWAEIVSESLEQQLQKAKAEVKRLEKEIKEENKIKVGDWVFIKETGTTFKAKESDLAHIGCRHRKITNPQLIELLENEIK